MRRWPRSATKFRAGALSTHNIPLDKADEVFDLMEKFAGYGFNKSHAAAYALLAYHTAWIKVHYAAEFFCANMTVEMDNTDKLKVLFEDAEKMGLEFEPPNVNRGFHRFEPISNKANPLRAGRQSRARASRRLKPSSPRVRAGVRPKKRARSRACLTSAAALTAAA